MKLFRVNNVDEFFNTFPKATTILNQADNAFSNSPGILKNIPILSQSTFSNGIMKIKVSLQRIVFIGEHELHYYDITIDE